MFQTSVGTQPAPGLAGTFAGAGPRTAVVAGPGGLVAGTSLFAARAAWTTAPLLGSSFFWSGSASIRIRKKSFPHIPPRIRDPRIGPMTSRSESISSVLLSATATP